MAHTKDHVDFPPDFRKLFDAAPGLYLVLKPDLTIAAVSNAYALATMIEPFAVIGRDTFDVFPDNPDNPQADGVRNLRASLTRVLRTGRADAMPVQQYDIRKPDGAFEERHWSPLNVPVLAEGGEVRWIIHRVEDVTDLVHLKSKRAGQDKIARHQQHIIEELRSANTQLAQTLSDNNLLERQHAYLASIVESSGDVIFSKTLEGIITSWNKAAETLFGYPAAEIVGQPVALLIPPEFLPEESQLIARVTAGEIVPRCETTRLTKDGRRIEISRTLSPIHDRKGNAIGASVIARDITAQKNAEREIRDLQVERSFLADLVASSNDAIVSRAMDGKIRSWNHAAELMFGFSAAEMIGHSAELPPYLQAEAAAVIERLRRGEAIIQYETRRPHKDGRDIQVSFTASLIRNREGDILGTSGILRDITARKRAQADSIALQTEMAHVSRLSAMGQMSVTIAHELNQPLSAIHNYLAAGQRLTESGAPTSAQLAKTREAMEKAGEQALRAGAIIRWLRDFVENRETAKSPQNLPGLIHEAVMLGMLGHENSHVRTRLALDPTTPSMLLNKVQIQQVLVNLVRNALEAMAQTPKPELHISLTATPEGATITVRDNGPGFSPEVVDRLFEPFVTTKESGMGIGLRVCQSIVDAHGGTISAANAEPGAVFVIQLPR
jgi:two-component system sensor kinase FixL